MTATPATAPAIGRRRRRSSRSRRCTGPAGLPRVELFAQIVEAVLQEVLPPGRTRLRAPTHHAELVDVQEARAGPATERGRSGLDEGLTVIPALLGRAPDLRLRPRVGLELLRGRCTCPSSSCSSRTRGEALGARTPRPGSPPRAESYPPRRSRPRWKSAAPGSRASCAAC